MSAVENGFLVEPVANFPEASVLFGYENNHGFGNFSFVLDYVAR